MCGIVGILGPANESPRARQLIRHMLAAIRYRGPDQFGFYHFQSDSVHLSLGHARLSVIDPSGGQQPIGSEDRTKWIVFNGEVFNYVELRRSLETKGHRFHTQTDTEVVLHMYEEYGRDFVSQLNGQFALAIWDESAQQLFLARDPMGILPLYYAQQQDRLVFGSEIRSILADRQVSASLDPLALDQVFTYWAPRPPQTIVREIQSIPPGCRAIVSTNRRLCVERYDSLAFPARGNEPLTDVNEAAEQLRELLEEATRIRLRADVPVGAYLSGGLDSSALTALARRIRGERLETFSVAFTDQDFDERGPQATMADYLGTRHHMVSCSPDDVGAVFPEVVLHAETPLLRTAPAPLFMLSRRVQQTGIKVVLTGEGADEFLGGYNVFKEAKIRRFWGRNPDSRWRPALLDRLYAYIPRLGESGNSFLQQFFGQGLCDASPYYSHQVRWGSTSRLKRLFSPELSHRIAEARSLAGRRSPDDYSDIPLPLEFRRWSNLAQAQYLEVTTFLSDYLLSSQGDRMLMAHGVEGRFPFLDPRVIRFCNELTPRLKLCGLNEKFVLRRAMKSHLPAAICSRPKRPFRAPIQNSFFQDGKPRDWVAEVTSHSALVDAECFGPRAVEMLMAKARGPRPLSEFDGMALIGVLSTQLLVRGLIDRRPDYQTIEPSDRVKIVDRHRTREAADRHLTQLEN